MIPKIIPSGAGYRLIVLGDNQTIKLTGEDTNGAFTLMEQSNPPGIGVPLHVHQNEDELFYIVEGSVAFTIGEQSVVAEAGATVLLPRGIPHAVMTTGSISVKTLVTIIPSGIEAMFQELSELPADAPDMTKALEICARYGITFLSAPDPADDDLTSI